MKKEKNYVPLPEGCEAFRGSWILGFNLHTDAYRGRFFDAYGRDRVDEDLIRVVAAAEVFG
jgi:kanamycin kinase